MFENPDPRDNTHLPLSSSVGPGTLRDAYEHERRRATMLEQVVVDQLATMGLLLAEHTRQIAALEGKAKPKSSIIKLVD